MRRFLLLLVCGLVLVPSASAATILGVSDDRSRFRSLTGQRSQVGHAFLGWGQGNTWGKSFAHFFSHYGEMPMLAMRTGHYPRKEVITPRQIAMGGGDRYLIAYNRAISRTAKTVWIRPMPEMNGHWNVYCAYNANGTRRNKAHSTANFRKAFRRIFLILHGGPKATINPKLSSFGMPGIGVDLPENPYPKLRVIWNPQGFGAPNLKANSAAAYFPGNSYIDVVGNDLYFQGSAAWAAAAKLYRAYPRKPYVFGEWGLWGRDNPDFIKRMRAFVRARPRVKMIAYYQGRRGSVFDLATKPRSRAAYRRLITPLGP